MPSLLPGILTTYSLVALSLISVAADYYVDNANVSVAYAASGTSWKTYSFATQNITLGSSAGLVVVDSSLCYHHNYALAACTVDQNCQITIPFTGSGISVHVVHAGFQGVAATLNIDGGQPFTATLPPATPPSYQTNNVSLFNVQSLPKTPHSATIHLLSWENTATSLYFDYARINETDPNLAVLPSPNPSLSPSTAAVPTSYISAPRSLSSTVFSTPPTTSPFTSTPTSPATSVTFNIASRSAPNLRAILGGACSGVAAFIVILTAIIYLKKHVSHHTKLEDSRRPNPFPAIPPVTHDQIVPPPTHPPTNEKMRLRLAALAAAVSQSPTEFVGPSNDLQSPHPSSDGSERAQGAEAGPSSADPFPLEVLVIDRRREDESFSGFRCSVVRGTHPRPLVNPAPPGYEP